LDLFFIPAWPLAAGGLPWFAVLLLAALLAGEWLRIRLGLPRLLGWTACGFAAGAAGLDASTIPGVRSLLDVAVGMVLFELGQRVDYGWLRRNPWLLATSFAESALGFAAALGILLLLGTPPLLAATAAAIGIATSPAVALTLARDLRAQGQVTERMLMLTALNCTYAFLAASMLLAWQHSEYRGDWRVTLAHPLYLIGVSLLVAAAFAQATLALLGRLARRADAQAVCVVAMVVTAVGTAELLRGSVTLALLAFGALARAWDEDRRFVALDSGRIGQIAVILLVTLTAAMLEFRVLWIAAPAGAALLAARWAGKALGLFLFARPSGLPLRKASLLALTLMPMSGVSMVIAHDTARLFPELGAFLAAIVLAATALLELLGPLAAHFALVRAREADPDA